MWHQLKVKLQRIGIKHQVIHLDCCSAGGIFASTRAATDAFAIEMAQRPSVSAVAAVTATEEAIESGGNGLFTKVRDQGVVAWRIRATSR